VVAVGALLLLAGCNDEAGGGSPAAASAAPAQVMLSPADGATDVSPAGPLEITVAGGELGEVTVTDGSGAAVAGSVAAEPAGASASSSPSASASAAPSAGPGGATTEVWTPDEQLDYGTTYTLTAAAENAGGATAEATTRFTTVTPEKQATPSIGPLDGTTVGVGMPIRVYFDHPVTDKAAVESHLRVESSTPTDGVWSWLSDTEAHFRPSTYWPADTDVTVHADLYGIDFGDGVWGQKDRTVSFHVGDEHRSIADAATHTLQVYDGGELGKTFPMSAGSQANPSHNGIHVVTELKRRTVMDSSTFGLAVDAPGG
jgi:hypothetical protein